MIQIDIKMPVSCSECFAYHEGTSYDNFPPRCEAMRKDGEFLGKSVKNINRFEERPAWCPLKEVG